jgi:hypothetical protein
LTGAGHGCQIPHVTATGLSPWRRALARAVARRVAVSTLVAGVAPLLTYLIVRPQVESVAAALAVTFAVPVAWAGLAGLWRRRLDVDGILTISAYGIALALTIFTGGSALPLKLRSAAETGAAGVACLVSVVLRRPVVLLALRLRARQVAPRAWRGAVWRKPAGERRAGRKFSVITVLVGAGLLVEAATQVALAFLTPTVVYVAASLPTRFAVYGSGAGLFFFVRARAPKRPRARPSRSALSRPERPEGPGTEP